GGMALLYAGPVRLAVDVRVRRFGADGGRVGAPASAGLNYAGDRPSAGRQRRSLAESRRVAAVSASLIAR
ncbi:hypothetical protein CVE36_07055, partial [Pseudomonas syringae pv. actinidiae]|nr:hypothetical protein [Pseudomonas syringae pv. actinidiae]